MKLLLFSDLHTDRTAAESSAERRESAERCVTALVGILVQAGGFFLNTAIGQPGQS